MAFSIEGRPLRVCFIAPAIYSTLSPGTGVALTGGAEVQQKILGEALAARGVEVSYVTHDLGQPDGQRIGGLTVFKSYREDAGIAGLRFFYPRVPGLWSALKRAGADIYYVRGAGYLPGLVSLFCRRNGRRFIFACASDANVDLKLLRLPTIRDRWLYVHGIRRADAIIVQSHQQAAALMNNLGLQGRVIRNIWHSAASALPESRRRYILWVAMFRELKQPEHFIRLARAFPDQEFVMIGGPYRGTVSYYQQVQRQAQAVPNLRFLGYRRMEETEQYFDQARLLVNTSRYEGFPNTFLQAWARSLPVLSYVDPDGLIDRLGLGAVAGNEEQLHRVLGRLLQQEQFRAGDIVGYFNRHHAPAAIVSGYQQVFESLRATGPPVLTEPLS
ncbi:MAG: glycosyltransferase family 4 protein [Aquisalimonadaceae bacterium]